VPHNLAGAVFSFVYWHQFNTVTSGGVISPGRSGAPQVFSHCS
jgi:hypothetical protein